MREFAEFRARFDDQEFLTVAELIKSTRLFLHSMTDLSSDDPKTHNFRRAMMKVIDYFEDQRELLGLDEDDKKNIYVVPEKTLPVIAAAPVAK